MYGTKTDLVYAGEHLYPIHSFNQIISLLQFSNRNSSKKKKNELVNKKKTIK